MILCITPNPAIDRTLLLPNLAVGNVQRAEEVIVAAGGKGLNVARSIHALGGASLSLGFAGGHTGRLLADLARADGLDASWTGIHSETRTCIILVSPEIGATEIDEPGLPVSKSDWMQLQQDVRQHISPGSFACVCGSLPPGSSAEDLQALLQLLVDGCRQVWVDTSGLALNAALAHPGSCIKVNAVEISKALRFEVKDLISAQHALNLLAERGIVTAVITLGADGALLAAPEGRWHAWGPPVRVVSTTGSGDSFLGGLLKALDASRDWPSALRDGVAAGTANALSAGGGRFTLQEFNSIREQVQIQAR